MAGRTTNRRNTSATEFVANDITGIPTNAAYDAISPTYSRMDLRRTFGSLRRAFTLIKNYAANTTNAAPTVANALVDQSVNELEALSYQFAANTFDDAESQTLTYTATLSDGSALPGWLTFTAGTRTFSGTAPSVDEDTNIEVTVRATDIYSRYVEDTFIITITNVA